MCRRILLLLILRAYTAAPCTAQIEDDFSDLDLSHDPPWTGELERWRTGVLDDDPALQSYGEAHADTIFLNLVTDASFGRWEFTFAHRDVNLSTFNGARVFLSLNAADPGDAANGYFLQLGTNNSDAVSLWRVDGGLDNRTELGRSAKPLVIGDTSLIRVAVTRDLASNWEVTANDSLVIQASDGRYTEGGYFTIWVKHTAKGADAFFFDDLRIVPTEYEPPPPPPPSPRPAALDVVVNEIQFDPLPGGSEFVELYNRSDSTFNLQRFTFRDSRSPPLNLIDSTLLLPPGSYAVIVSDSEAFEAQFRRIPFVDPSRWAALNNGGDFVALEYEGVMIDSVSYGNDVAPTGFSLERIDPDGPSEPFNFEPSRNPFGATPGEINSVYEPDLVGPELLFAEQIKTRSVRLYFDEPLDPHSISPASVHVDGADVDSIAMESTLSPTLHLSRQPAAGSVTLSGTMDRRGNVSGVLSMPIAFIPLEDDIVVNEIMYEPRTDHFDGRPNQSEYVELYNRSSHLVSLTNLYATRRTDEDGNTDTVDVGLPRKGLGAGEHFVVLRDSAMTYLLDATPFAVASALSLPNSGDIFRLHHSSGMLIDSLGYDPSLHHPDLADSRGISLERIDADGSSTDPANWTSSVDTSGGTPGRPNSVRASGEPPKEASGLSVSPNPFSPDRDGRDDVAAISYRLRSNPTLVRVRIFDHRGVVVRRLIPSQLVGNAGTFFWNGLDDAGRRLRTGIYIVLLEAFDSRNQSGESYKAALVLTRTF